MTSSEIADIVEFLLRPLAGTKNGLGTIQICYGERPLWRIKERPQCDNGTSFPCMRFYAKRSDAQSGIKASLEPSLEQRRLFHARIVFGAWPTLTDYSISHRMNDMVTVIKHDPSLYFLLFYGLPGIMVFLMSGFFVCNALNPFPGTKIISTVLTLAGVMAGVTHLRIGACQYDFQAIGMKTRLLLDLKMMAFAINYRCPGIEEHSIRAYV